MATGVLKAIDEVFNSHAVRKHSRLISGSLVVGGFVSGLTSAIFAAPTAAAGCGLILGTGVMMLFAASKDEHILQRFKDVIAGTKDARSVAGITLVAYPLILAGAGFLVQYLNRDAANNAEAAARVANANQQQFGSLPALKAQQPVYTREVTASEVCKGNAGGEAIALPDRKTAYVYPSKAKPEILVRCD